MAGYQRNIAPLLRRCLANDADAHAHAELTPPPLSALREYSTKLQAQLQEVSHNLHNLLDMLCRASQSFAF